jgi:hypothetical protein
MEAMMKLQSRRDKTIIDSTKLKLNETVKHQVKNILTYIYQRLYVIYMEHSEKIEQTQLGLQAVITQTWNLHEDLLDTKAELQGVLDHRIQETPMY